ncbi:MAG: glycine betaine ABC transporter substrate-binding protein [Rhodanobacter sp.]|jgi:glycine betaine/proline transport system substrate-binding protein|nr:glycine betaine ABC transporter substrate-binding protein [Rhodanobacter sp.]
MKSAHFRLRTIIASVLAAAVLGGCSQSADETPAAKTATSSSVASPATSASGDIKLVYVEWSSCTAATNVIKAVLEQQGFHVNAIAVSGAAMYSALAHGDADATVCAWLPSTQANYYTKTRDELSNLGPNMSGTRIGLVVPDYVTINSIGELAANADKFQNRIVGIDPGAGEMGITQKAIAAYKLPLKLVDGSGATMAAALKDAIDNHQWIAVTGWTPHWMWARWQLKYLSDPKGIFGGAEDIDTLVRKGLKKDMPKAYATLDAFKWTPADMQQVMAANQEPGADAQDNASKWVKAHADLVSGWVSAKP